MGVIRLNPKSKIKLYKIKNAFQHILVCRLKFLPILAVSMRKENRDHEV